MRLEHGAAERLTAALADAYGRQDWWPADTPFEVMVGAVLTQRTSWHNAELALAALRDASLLEAHALAVVPLARVEALVRPAGFYRQKARRLQGLGRWVMDAGGIAGAARLSDRALREALLELDGIGPETADAIALYAFARPRFVVDAYARRLLSRLGLIVGDEPYEALRRAVEGTLPADAGVLGELHALIVQHAKAHCRARPACAGCALAVQCPYPGQVHAAAR